MQRFAHSLCMSNNAAPAIDIKLFITQIIFEPGRKREVADEYRRSQAQVSEMLPYPQAAQVLQAPRITWSQKKNPDQLLQFNINLNQEWYPNRTYSGHGRYPTTASAPARSP